MTGRSEASLSRPFGTGRLHFVQVLGLFVWFYAATAAIRFANANYEQAKADGLYGLILLATLFGFGSLLLIAIIGLRQVFARPPDTHEQSVAPDYGGKLAWSLIGLIHGVALAMAFVLTLQVRAIALEGAAIDPGAFRAAAIAFAALGVSGGSYGLIGLLTGRRALFRAQGYLVIGVILGVIAAAAGWVVPLVAIGPGRFLL